jgi:hypothetical protein
MADGCAMLADDITAVRLASDGHVEVLPGVARIHLTESAANGLGYDTAPELVQRSRRMKLSIPTDQRMAIAPARLRAIYLLDTHPGPELLVSSLRGAEKFAALQSCIYGPLFAEEHPALFPLCAAVVRQVEVYRIDRPQDRWSVESVKDVMLASTPVTGHGSGFASRA